MFTLRHDDREDGLVNERNDHLGIDTGPQETTTTRSR